MRSAILLLLILVGIYLLPLTQAFAQPTIVNTVPTPYNTLYYPQGAMDITTNGTTATFYLYLFNPTFMPENITVHVSSTVHVTVPLPSYSYQIIPISLSLGSHIITISNQTLYVEVYHSTYQPVTTYINGSPNIYVLKAQPGKTYTFQVSFSSTPNSTVDASVYTDIGFFKPTTYQQGATPTLLPGNLFSVQVPQGIPQGIYYAYIYTKFENATNGALLSYSLGVVIFNISYGIPSSLQFPETVTENGVTVELQNISRYTYLYIGYPFSYENSYTISTPSWTVEIGNLTEVNNVFPSFIGTPQLLYYGSNVPVAVSPQGIIIKLPQFGKANITIKSLNGTTTLTIPPKIKFGKLNVEVLSVNGTPITDAKVYVHNSTSNSLLSTLVTNSSGFVSYSLPIGSNVNIITSAPGYFTNLTAVVISKTTTVKVFLVPVKITVTLVKLTENGSPVIPTIISAQRYVANATIDSNFSTFFSANINGKVTLNVTAYLNGSRTSVIPLGNGEYEVTQIFKTPGNYILTINVSYNGVSKTLTVLINAQQKIVATTTSTHTTIVTKTTSIITTSQSLGNSSFKPILIIPIIIIIIVIVFLIIKRRKNSKKKKKKLKKNNDKKKKKRNI